MGSSPPTNVSIDMLWFGLRQVRRGVLRPPPEEGGGPTLKVCKFIFVCRNRVGPDALFGQQLFALYDSA